jgi:hypothetical protein
MVSSFSLFLKFVFEIAIEVTFSRKESFYYVLISVETASK